VQLETQMEEIASLEETNSLMVKQLKVNQEKAAKLQEEALQAWQKYNDCNRRLELENGKVIALSVQLNKRDHWEEALLHV